MSNKRGFIPYIFFILIIFIFLPIGCIGENKQLEFETIIQGDMSGYKEQKEKFFLVKSDVDWDNLWKSYFQGEKLYVDFYEYIVIAAFQGEKNTGGYEINIKNISQKGNDIDVIIEFKEPKGPAIMVLTQPYHIVKLNRSQIRDPFNIKFTYIKKN